MKVILLLLLTQAPTLNYFNPEPLTMSPLTTDENRMFLYLSYLEQKANYNDQHECLVVHQFAPNKSRCEDASKKSEAASLKRMMYEHTLAIKYGTIFFEFDPQGYTIPCRSCVLVGKL